MIELFFFLATLLLFYFVARLSIVISLLAASARLVTVYFYFFFFPDSDVSLLYHPESLQCGSYLPLIGNSFIYLMRYLNCSLGISSLIHQSQLFSLVPVGALSLLYRSISKSPHLTLAPNSLFSLFFLFDPSLLLFSSAAGKDSLSLAFTCLLLAHIFHRDRITSLFVIIIGLLLFTSRPYYLILFSFPLLASFISPPSVFSNLSSDPLGLTLIPSKVRPFKLVLILGLLFLTVTSLFTIGLSLFDLATFDSVFNRWNISMGGNLSIPVNLPFILKYFAFWLLPFPFIQSGYGALVLGLSTYYSVYLLNGLRVRNLLSRPVCGYLLYYILFVSLFFSSTLSNTGISCRYRATLALPVLFILSLFRPNTSNNSHV